MGKENKTTQNCDCSSDCCQPSKNKSWMKIVFIVIVVAALAIATIKLFNQNRTGTKGATSPIVKSECCDSIKQDTSAKVCNPEKNSSCCPKAKEKWKNGYNRF
jgi:hypothetical protein